LAPRSAAPTSGRRFPGIEGLRAIAATSVLIGHVYPLGDMSGAVHAWVLRHVLPVTSVGVTLFFTLSGFLLYRPFVTAAIRREDANIPRYLRNRALRILPAYWAVLIIGVFIGTLAQPHASGLGGAPTVGTFLSWAFLLEQFRTATAFSGVPLAWSLVVEVCFYLILPLLGIVAWRATSRATSLRRRRAALLAPVALMALIGCTGLLVLRLTPDQKGGPFAANWHAVLGRSFWVMASLFCGGMIVAVIRAERDAGNLRLPRRWAAATATIGVLAVILGDRLGDVGTIRYHLYQLTMMVACTCLVALVALGGVKSHVVRVLESRPLVFLGIISYGIFLWHLPLLAVLQRNRLTATSAVAPLVNIPLVLVASIAVAYLSWRIVERPALALKGRFIRIG
jgi:peptidoglycan/LPS O-acetylase OafA/YrhL